MSQDQIKRQGPCENGYECRDLSMPPTKLNRMSLNVMLLQHRNDVPPAAQMMTLGDRDKIERHIVNNNREHGTPATENKTKTTAKSCEWKRRLTQKISDKQIVKETFHEN